MRTILVTGGTGQLGTAFVPRLAAAGFDPLLIGRSPACPLRADLARREELAAFAEALRPVEILVHAAHPMRSAEPDAPEAAALLTESVAAAAGLLGLLPSLRRAVLVSSTSAEEPRDLYGVSKRLDEDLFRLHAEDRGIALTVLRVSSVYGPGGRVRRALERFLREALAGRPPVVRGGGGPGTDYVYLDDAAEAIARAAEAEAAGLAHVSSGEAFPPLEAARRAMRAAGLAGEPEVVPGPPSGTGPVDNGDAWRLLSWRPRHDLDAGLREFARRLRCTA